MPTSERSTYVRERIKQSIEKGKIISQLRRMNLGDLIRESQRMVAQHPGVVDENSTIDVDYKDRYELIIFEINTRYPSPDSSQQTL